MMKVLIFCIIVIGLSGCSKGANANNGFYDRDNSASEKSLQGLEKDTR